MKFILALLVCTMLAGCSSNNAHTYGNFTEVSKQQRDFNTALAIESAVQLQTSYTAASTTLSLTHPANDEFGKQLIKTLRAKGFAVAEYAPEVKTPGKRLSYIVDYAGANHIVVTLRVDDTVIARLFDSQNNRLAAVGSWSRLE